MVDRWESPEYSVFSSVGDRCIGFLVDCPEFLEYLPVKVKKIWIRLAANTRG